jgi:type II secretory ATPase GspE/PulE/Tfp pilus assembly ATPase PilB-like protein
MACRARCAVRRKGMLEPASGILNFEQLLELGRRGELSADERPIVQIVDWLLQYAFAQRASDIHLEPRREQGQIRFRIDGVLHAIYQLPSAVMSAVTSRIKILGRMDVAEKRRPQDGRIKTRTPAGREIELRCPPCRPLSAKNACCASLILTRHQEFRPVRLRARRRSDLARR